MATGGQVLSMLIPEGGWYIFGDEYEGIKFTNCQPITKKQFEDGFAEYDIWKVEQDTIKATAKAALLQRLGITAEEALLLQ